MTLKEAIDMIDRELKKPSPRTSVLDWRCEIELVLAAARAFACETCEGTGIIDSNKVDDTYPIGHSWIGCTDCREDRKIARGE